MAINKKLFFVMLAAVLMLAMRIVYSRSEPKCGIENCHGLNITCGPNIPEVCTENYMLGDCCRRYASCEIIEGECKLVKSE